MFPGLSTGKDDAVMVLLRLLLPLYASEFSQSSVTDVPIEEIETAVLPIVTVPELEPFTTISGFASKPVGFRSVPPDVKVIAFSPDFKNF